MSGPVGALFYMRSVALRNAFVSRLKRLRQPKYLIGGVVGLAYVYFVFLRRMQVGRPGLAQTGGLFPDEFVLAVHMSGALLLTTVALLCWLWDRDRAALNFSEAEIAFLFPAPIARRTLVHYRLLSVHLRVLVSAAILAVFTGPWGFLSANGWIRFAGWWLIFVTIALHVTGSSFAITRLMDRGVTTLRRRLFVAGGIVVLSVATVLWAGSDLRGPTAEELGSLRGISSYLVALLRSGLLPYLLMPAKLILGPLFAADVRSFVVALVYALPVYAVHYIWVLRNEVGFEEASIVKAEKRAARLAALRPGNWRTHKVRRAPFDLSKVRRPELAFLWKNLLSSGRYLGLRTVSILAAAIVVGCNWLASHPEYDVQRQGLAMLSLSAAAYLLVIGPQFARQDLRSDLFNADILKTYPLRGWQIVLGEILTPAMLVTTYLWLFLLAAALSFEPQNLPWLTLPVRFGIAATLALLAPLLCALQLLVVNAAAMLFPAWLQTSRSRTPPGIEVMGQRIFFVLGQVLVIFVALLPAAILAGSVYATLQWTVNVPVAAVFATLTVFVVIGIEVVLGLAWLGRLFERFDLSAELRP